MKPKIITTTIESDITFMTDPKVEFVSLVKHGANRMPFKVLKSDKGGKPMKGIVQAILLSKDLPKETVSEILMDLKSEDKKEFETHVKYVQRDPEDFEPESLEVTTEKEGVYYVLGVLKEKADKKDDDVEKDLDPASLDDLYMALYAMADMVSGTMRQENSTPAFKRKTILSAIDNFRNFAESLLKNAKDATLAVAVKAEDHPTLVETFVMKAKETDEEKAERESAEKEAAEKAAAEKKDAQKAEIDQLVETLTESYKEGLKSLEETLNKVITELKETVTNKSEEIDSLKEEVETLKAAPINSQTIIDDDPTDTRSPEEKKAAIFNGLLYNRTK
jgi:hypothetical protein